MVAIRAHLLLLVLTLDAPAEHTEPRARCTLYSVPQPNASQSWHTHCSPINLKSL